MADFGNAIKYLYEKFLLRDLLSFITPGAIVVLTAFVLFIQEPSLVQRLDTLFEYSRDMYWLLYIPLFGLFFLVGFAIQCFGEIVGLIRIHVDAKGCCRQRFKIFLCKKWDDKSNIWWKKAHEDAVDFAEATYRKEKDEGEWARNQHERLVVLKQMCANGFLAGVIAGVFLAVNYCPWPPAKLCVVSLVAFLLLVSLF